MKQEQLKQLLTQLHAELHGADSVDAELAALLGTLNQDIRQVLSNQQVPDDPVYAALSERTLSLSATFAAKHPKLEPVLRELASMLAKIGV